MPEPAATTERLTVEPGGTDCDAGCVAMAGPGAPELTLSETSSMRQLPAVALVPPLA